jgi:asparagine synthase (glutamine-hydrolysing)
VSAIAGVARFDGAPVPLATVERMAGAMAHRGPDGIACWPGGPVALAHCAFHTTPESIGERQPLANRDASVVLVLDGRVDNRDELRAAIVARGGTVRDDTDAELVLAAYETFGEDCADRIVGEFAFVAWDARRRCLFGARDPAGRRHFYYHAARDWAAFASEIRALLAHGAIARRLNEARLVDSLVNAFDRVDQVATIYEGIERLPAGHCLRISPSGATTWRYWDPSRLAENRFSGPEECAEAFREELRVAVKARMRSTGPVGAMLSGGLDSSSVVALARAESLAAGLGPLKTFSLVREDREACPEWRNVTCIVGQGGIDPTFITPSVAGEAWRRHVDSIADSDEPFWVSYGYTTRLVCEAAQRAGCRVLLDGIDGDILFYWIDESIVLRRGALGLIPGVIAAARRHGEGEAWRALGMRVASALTPRQVRARYRRAAYRSAMAADARLLRAEIAQPLFARRWIDRPYGRPASDQAHHAAILASGAQAYSFETYGQIAFAHGIESRSPFADRRLMEFAVRMPLWAKSAAGWYKKTLRMACAGQLPDEVRWRRDVTMHPGGEFRRMLVDEIARGAQEVWNREGVERKMEKWVDAAELRRVWAEHECTRDVSKSLDLLVLVVAARWLGARFS